MFSQINAGQTSEGGEHPVRESEGKFFQEIKTLTQNHWKIWIYNTALAKWELNG